MGRIVAWVSLPVLMLAMGVDWLSWKVRGRPILWLERVLDEVFLPDSCQSPSARDNHCD